MGRAVLGLDRLAAIVVGLVLLVLGLAAAAWVPGGWCRCGPRPPSS